MKTLFIYLIAVVSGLLCSCGSVSEFQPYQTTGISANQTYSQVLVRDFSYSGDPEETEGPQSAENFPNKIAAEIQKAGAFASVARSGSANAQTLVIDGKITRFVEGAGSLRFWIGMGAGSAHFDSTIRFTDGGSQKAIGQIIGDKNSYAPGGAISAAQTPEVLMQTTAEKVAEEAIKFAPAAR